MLLFSDIVKIRIPLIFFGIAVFSLLAVSQVMLPATCSAQANCPVPAETGTQPFPTALHSVFNNASVGRLGASGPTLQDIHKGYPSFVSIPGHAPCVLLRAIAAVESEQTRGQAEFDGWKQFNAVYGERGTTVIAPDCGYGIMQITDGMNGLPFPAGTIDTKKVALSPSYNIGTGARVLVHKWNSIANAVGTNNPYILEHWYFAVMAYNSMSENNPTDNDFLDGRPAWKCGRDPNQNPELWPYQEKVWGCARNPPQYPAGTNLWAPVALTLPPLSAFENGIPTYIDTPTPSHDSHNPCTINCTRRSGELLMNGNFNTGTPAPWTMQRVNIPYSIVQPYQGNYAARLGQLNNVRDILYQNVCIPATATTITLRYSWLVNTQETSGNPYDYVDVGVYDVYGNLLVPLPRITNSSTPRGTWNTVTRTLSSTYAGRTLRIRFDAVNDASRPTDFWIDNVSVSVTLNGTP